MADAEPLPLVLDINVLVAAVVGGNSPFRSWPSPPPTTDNASADCLGVVNDAREFALWLSEHILRNTLRVLVDPVSGYGWDRGRAQEYVGILVEIAGASGGGVSQPQGTVSDLDDHEDNRILELARACNAALVVTLDGAFLRASPWKGIPIIHPREFSARVSEMRRKARRK